MKSLDLIYWTWCLPQTLVGFLLKKALKSKIKTEESYKLGTDVCWIDWDYGVSLGKYILVSTGYQKYDGDGGLNTKNHEYGHVKQSLILGWLYLIVVGIPSMIFNLISQVSEKFFKNYYNRFPENWADHLGHVVRK